MDFLELKTLIALVDTGSVTLTAQRMNRVPSAITSRLQQLEDYLGAQLFLREKKRLIATPQALLLYGYAQQIIHLATEAENKIKCNVTGGKFRLGALESIAATRLPPIFTKLYDTYPTLEIDLTTGIRDHLYQGLMDGQFDAIFIADGYKDPNLDRMPVFNEELVLIAAKNQTRISTPTDLMRQTILVFQNGCSYRDRLLDWFSYFEMQPSRIAEVTSYHAILGSVAAGMGVGIVPKIMIEQFTNRDSISIHPLSSPFNRVQTELIWKKNLTSANIIGLQQCLKDVFEDV